MPERFTCLSTPVTLVSREEVFSAIDKATATEPVRLATLNPEFMLDAQKNPGFRAALGHMTHCTVDGSGLYFALRLYSFFHKKPAVVEHFPGADMVEALFSRYSDGSKRFFLLGGPPSMAQAAGKLIQKNHPGVVISGATDGGVIPAKPTAPDNALLQQIEHAKPDILLVGFGSPKQELWINEAAKSLAVPVMVGVGGTIEFYGQKKRAPQQWRNLHMEWLYRAFKEKGHWKRSLRATMVFGLRSLYWLLTSR